MTENQEKELFTTLASLVSGVGQIQSDVRDIKTAQAEHTATLAEHSQKLDLLVVKTDSIAETVMTHETRLNSVEGAVEDLGGKIH
jgi:hypothetical protein